MGRERPISDERDVKAFGPFGKWPKDDEPKEKPAHKWEVSKNPEDDLIAKIDAKRNRTQQQRSADNPEPLDTRDTNLVDELVDEGLGEAEDAAPQEPAPADQLVDDTIEDSPGLAKVKKLAWAPEERAQKRYDSEGRKSLSKIIRQDRDKRTIKE